MVLVRAGFRRAEHKDAVAVTVDALLPDYQREGLRRGSPGEGRSAEHANTLLRDRPWNNIAPRTKSQSSTTIAVIAMTGTEMEMILDESHVV
jgi:hypothetical protein